MLSPKKIIGASFTLVAMSMLAASDADAQVCTTSALTYDEGFDTTTFKDASTSAAGWGTGIVQLAFKGNTFDSSSQNIGEKVFVIGAGDFDNDGWIDMAAIMLNPDRLHFLKNMGINPDGSHKGFSTGGAANSAGWTAQIIDNNIPDFDTNSPSVVAGDFDGDGDPDVLYMKTGTQDNAGSVIRAFVYRLDNVVGGIPKFTRIELTSFFQTYRVSWHWTSNFSQTLDWDKDGRTDLVTGSSWGGTTDKVMLFKASKTGIGFDPPITIIADAGLTGPFADTSTGATGGSTCVPPSKSGFYSRGIGSVGVDDFDGDGDYDIVVGSLSEKDMKLWLNDGSDVMTRAADIIWTAGAATFILVGDIDGDGDSDVTVGRDGWNCNGTGGTVWFYANDGKANFTPRTLPILSAGSDLDFGAAFYIDENIKFPSLNAHPDYTIDIIAADGNDSGTYNEILAQRSTVYNLTGSAVSSIIDSLDNTTNAIVAVTMTGLKDTVPLTTGIKFFVSNDNGQDWEQLLPTEIYNGARPATHTFTHFGSDFRFRADLSTAQVSLLGTEASLAPGSRRHRSSMI